MNLKWLEYLKKLCGMDLLELTNHPIGKREFVV